MLYISLRIFQWQKYHFNLNNFWPIFLQIMPFYKQRSQIWNDQKKKKKKEYFGTHTYQIVILGILCACTQCHVYIVVT
jgi:hypothetical protein